MKTKRHLIFTFVSLLAALAWMGCIGLAHAQTTVYQDSFSRGSSGSVAVLGGSRPDVADTNNNVWTANGGNNLGNAGSYFTNGSAAIL